MSTDTGQAAIAVLEGNRREGARLYHGEAWEARKRKKETWWCFARWVTRK